MADLTRKAFYELAETCREFALELARREQDRVSPSHSRQFNLWLPQILAYPPLAARLQDMGPARQITRNQVVAGAGLLLLVAAFFLRDELGRTWLNVYFWSGSTALILLWFLPESLYSTTVAQIEGKVLRITELLEEMLLSGQMEFSEAAFFKTKENLGVAREEMRQQIYLARHR